MKRTLISWMAAAGVTFAAVSASAAIALLSGPSTATPGQTILITTTVSTGTGPADVPNVAAGGNILYPNQFVNPNIPGSSQNLIPNLATLGGLDCTTARCRAFNQIGTPGDSPSVPNVTNFLLSQTSFIIDPSTPVGTVITFAWQTSPATQSLNFFGALPTDTHVVTVVPEPTTVAMVGLGLLGLVAAGRRRD